MADDDDSLIKDRLPFIAAQQAVRGVLNRSLVYWSHFLMIIVPTIGLILGCYAFAFNRTSGGTQTMLDIERRMTQIEASVCKQALNTSLIAKQLGVELPEEAKVTCKW